MCDWKLYSCFQQVLLALLTVLSGQITASAAAPTTTAKNTVDFNRDIRPIFSENCYACHGPDGEKRKAGLRLDRKEGALAELKSGNRAIVPSEVVNSALIARITASDLDDLMPPVKSGKKLTRAQIELLRAWISQGAAFAAHWSYVKPTKPAVPTKEFSKLTAYENNRSTEPHSGPHRWLPLPEVAQLVRLSEQPSTRVVRSPRTLR